MYEDTFHSPPNQEKVDQTIRSLRMQYGDEFLLHVAETIRKGHGRGPKPKNDEEMHDRMADLILSNPGTTFSNAATQVAKSIPVHEHSEDATRKRIYENFCKRQKLLLEVAKARQTMMEGALEAQSILKKLEVGELIEAQKLKNVCVRISPANIDANTVLSVIEGKNAYSNSALAIMRFALGFKITMLLSEIVGLLEKIATISGPLQNLYDLDRQNKKYAETKAQICSSAIKISPLIEYFLSDNIGSLREAYRMNIHF